MPTLKDALHLKENPFENYTAESEPNISAYAVKPPYIDTINQRVLSKKSFILFGDRGAGKSATRVTLFNDIWKDLVDYDKPFIVNFLDYSACLVKLRDGNLQEWDILKEVAYLVLEQLLIWLTSLGESDRRIYTESLTPEEMSHLIVMLRAFYLSRPEVDRKVSESAALRLLGHAWSMRGILWASKRWDALSKLVGNIADIFAKKVDKDADIGGAVQDLLKNTSASASGGRVLLEKLVDTVKIFSFSGIVVLVDKVDETEITTNSAQNTAQLISPILSHVQLLEVEGFAWVFFLWGDIRPHFEKEGKIRLDKIANTSIEWSVPFLKKMLNERVRFFSDKRLEFSALFASEIDVEGNAEDLIRLSMRSPRELVRLLDIIVAEHDAKYASLDKVVLLDNQSLDAGKDKYVTTRIYDLFDRETVRQVCRVAKMQFINKDLQSAFRISASGARNKIIAWQAAGIIKQTGTRAQEGDQGGKPNYEYTVTDARIGRLIERSLIQIDDLASEEAELDLDL